MSGQNLTRRGLLQAVGAGAALLATRPWAGALATEPKRKPNIVFILVDDLGWADLGCYGSRYHETPNLDKLASQGMRFTNAYAACAVCSPTRAAVMTGRYPARLGVTDWIRSRFQGGKIPEDKKNPTKHVGDKKQKLLCPPNALWLESQEITIAEALQQAGYVSCHIGKWHLGTDDWYPEKQGFEYNIGGCDFGQPPTYFDPYFRKGQGDIPTLAARRPGEYLTDREADEAVRFLREHKDRPFFLHLAHYAVHTPIEAKAEVTKKYEAKPPTQQKNARYAAMIESVDDAVGRICAVLDELGLADNTAIFFTSDNGGLLPVTNNTPLRSGKGYPYEGGIRAPLIVRWPGVVPAGSTSDEPVTSVDYFPTLCEAAGVPLPADREIDGVSLVGHLQSAGRQPLDRDVLFWHFPHYRGADVVPYSIIRAGDWKLIKRYEGKTFELFDLKNDLGERNDLADARPEKTQELDAKLREWLTRTHAKLPIPNPDYEPPAGRTR
ncbi:MAG: sulfatase [Planctomycetes bacterium]|nr:sulfatase [Planctomycetota bacterium]